MYGFVLGCGGFNRMNGTVSVCSRRQSSIVSQAPPQVSATSADLLRGPVGHKTQAAWKALAMMCLAKSLLCTKRRQGCFRTGRRTAIRFRGGMARGIQPSWGLGRSCAGAAPITPLGPRLRGHLQQPPLRLRGLGLGF